MSVKVGGKSGIKGLQLPTQKKLRTLLQTIAKGEIACEQQRVFLASNENFEPYMAFQRIDRNEDGFVSSMELLYFLRDNGIHNVTEAQCYYIVKFFDSDEDGKLNYPDFMQMVLPCNDSKLRAVVTQRPNQFVSRYDYLTLDIERDLTKLVQNEVDLHKTGEPVRQQLESMLDFSKEALYKTIDDWGYGFIDQRNLKGFFRNMKASVTDEEVEAILRRIDLSGEGRVAMEEWFEGIRAQEPYSKMIVRDFMKNDEDVIRAKKQARIEASKGKRVKDRPEERDENAVAMQALDKNFDNVLNSSPLKKRADYDLSGTPGPKVKQEAAKAIRAAKLEEIRLQKSPNKGGSPLKQSPGGTKFTYKSEQHTTFMKSRAFGDTTTGSPMKGSNFKTPQKGAGGKDSLFQSDVTNMYMLSEGDQRVLRKEWEVEISNYFRNQLQIEKEIERLKIDLSLRTEFNLIDAFRLFDTDGKGWISGAEIKDGLQNFDIWAKSDDIKLWLMRNDRDEDGRLRYSEFCDGFLPVDSFHASLLAKKPPMHTFKLAASKDKVFYPETKALFIEAWKTFLAHETECERLRVSFTTKPYFDLRWVFQLCDVNQDGVIDKEDIKQLLLSVNVYVSDKEIACLISKYDRSRDKNITFHEFGEETMPKLE